MYDGGGGIMDCGFDGLLGLLGLVVRLGGDREEAEYGMTQSEDGVVNQISL